MHFTFIVLFTSNRHVDRNRYFTGKQHGANNCLQSWNENYFHDLRPFRFGFNGFPFSYLAFNIVAE